jgi:hypothetical protein
MPGNPLIDQGILNRIRGTFVLTNHPELNVTAPFLDRDGINFRLEGEMSTQHATMTGVVQSPEPYVPCSVVVALLKTQALAEAYKTQQENSVLLGPGVVFPDVAVSGLTQFQLYNLSIQNVGDLLFNGSTPIYAVTMRGFYIINNSLFN